MPCRADRARRSELFGSELSRVDRLMNSRVVETLGVLSNTAHRTGFLNHVPARGVAGLLQHGDGLREIREDRKGALHGTSRHRRMAGGIGGREALGWAGSGGGGGAVASMPPPPQPERTRAPAPGAEAGVHNRGALRTMREISGLLAIRRVVSSSTYSREVCLAVRVPRQQFNRLGVDPVGVARDSR